MATPAAADEGSTADEDAGADQAAPEAAAAPPRSPEQVREEDARWVEDRTGAVINTAFIAAALGVARRPPFREAASLLDRLAQNPRLAAGPSRSVLSELRRIVRGDSKLEPWKEDRRYSDPAWRSNRLLRSLAQAHAAVARGVDELLDRAELEPAADYRLRLAISNVAAAVSPPNFPLVNPASLKATVDTAGSNLVQGAGRFVHDMRTPPRLPLRSDPTDFRVGTDLAATPGAVVARSPLMELIQYRSRTRRVRVEPVLIVPSVVNKFYLTDMSPGRSLVEHGIRSGHQMFSLSWVNPDASHRDVGLDSYIQAIVEAIETVRSISESERVHVLGVCAGGQLASIALAYLAAKNGDAAIGSLTLLVCVLDYMGAGLPQGLLTRDSAELALGPIFRRGYVDGRELTLALAWLRPIDSVWWPWGQRYLIGAEMPKLDLFHWSEDVTNLPAAFVRDQMYLTLNNSLTEPGRLVVDGVPIDLTKVTADAYLVAGLTDHLTPWEACYETTQLLGSKSRFALVAGGHIQSILRPPSERIIPFFHGAETGSDAEEWLDNAELHEESWWDDWLRWLGERSPEERPMRRRLGSRAYPALDPAPGLYVRRRLDQT